MLTPIYTHTPTHIPIHIHTLLNPRIPLYTVMWLHTFVPLQDIDNTVDGSETLHSLSLIPLMEKIVHQLIGSLSHYLQVFYIPGGAGFLPSVSSF